MGLLFLIIIAVVIFIVIKSKPDSGNAANSNSKYENRMIGNMPIGNTYGPKEVMYVVGCVSYYATLLGEDVMVMAGMPSKDAETGTFVSISLEDISYISQFFPQDLKRAVDLIAWSTKTNKELKITFSMNKANYMNMRNDCIQAYRNGVLAAKSIETRSSLTPKPLYIWSANIHMWVIDNTNPSPAYANSCERIL